MKKKNLKNQPLIYGNLRLEKTLKQKYSQQNYYKVEVSKSEIEGLELNNTLEKLFTESEKEVRYILVTLKIQLKGTDQIIYMSDTFNYERLELIQDTGLTVMEKVMEKMTALPSYKGKILAVHIRTIHDIL